MPSSDSIRAGRAYVELSAKDETKKGFAAVTQKAKSFANSIKNIATSFAGLAAGAVSIGTLVTKFKALDELFDTAGKIGIAANRLQEFHHAAERSGSSVEAINGALPKMIKNVSEAAKGGKGLAESFAELNLDPKKLAKLTPEAMFREISEAIKNVKNDSDQLRLSMEVFGRGGADLLSMLTLGKEGLADMTREAHQLGKVLSEAEIAAIAPATDTAEKFSATWDGILNKLTVWLAKAEPTFQTILKAANRLDGTTDRVSREGFGVKSTADRTNAVDIKKQIAENNKLSQSLNADFTRLNAQRDAVLAAGGNGSWRKAGEMATDLDHIKAQIVDLAKDSEELLAAWRKLPQAVRETQLQSAALRPVWQALMGNGKSGKERIKGFFPAAGEMGKAIGEDIGGALKTTFNQATAASNLFQEIFPKANEMAIDRWRSAMQQEKAAFEEAVSRAEQITDSVKTPQQRFGEQMKEVADLFNKGLLSKDVYQRYVGKLNTDLQASIEASIKPAIDNVLRAAVPAANFLEQGSQAWAEEMARFMSPHAAEQDPIPQRQLNEIKAQTRFLRNIDRKMDNAVLAPANLNGN